MNKESRPKRQHFIPRSYLQNFAEKIDKKFFVEAKLKSESKPEDDLQSISNICVDKNLYTLPQVESDDKYRLERFYAQEVDGVYPEVYKLLVDPSVTTITAAQRAQIIMTTMSLFFRTPKFLNHNTKNSNRALEVTANRFKDQNGNVKFEYEGRRFDFHIDNLEEVKTDLKLRSKLKFLQNHLKDWHDFILYKSKVGIAVFHLYEDVDLITSDNPVVMNSVVGNPFNVFDPTNIICLPLDNRHFLKIFPNTVPDHNNRVLREERDKSFAFTTNHSVDQNSEVWILGKPNSITAHIADQAKYGQYTRENLRAYYEQEEKNNDLAEIWRIVNEEGTMAHQRVADKVKELHRKEIHRNDPILQKMIDKLKELGFPIE